MSIKNSSFFFLIGFSAVLLSNNGQGTPKLSGSTKASSSNGGFLFTSEVKKYNLTSPSLTEPLKTKKEGGIQVKKEKAPHLENQPNYAFALFENDSIYPSIHKIQAASTEKNYLGFFINPSTEDNTNLTDKNRWICFLIYDLKPVLLQTIQSNNILIFDLKQFDLSEKKITGDFTTASLGERLRLSKKPPDYPPIPLPIPMPYHFEPVDNFESESMFHTAGKYVVTTVHPAFSDNKNRETAVEKTTDIAFKQWTWGIENTAFLQNFTNYFTSCEEILP